VRERTLREIRQTVLEDDGAAVPLVIPRQKGETITDPDISGLREEGDRRSGLSARTARTASAAANPIEQ
jgi:hypothetical protein